MNKYLLRLFLVIMATFMLVGCGGSSGNDSNDSDIDWTPLGKTPSKEILDKTEYPGEEETGGYSYNGRLWHTYVSTAEIENNLMAMKDAEWNLVSSCYPLLHSLLVYYGALPAEEKIKILHSYITAKTSVAGGQDFTYGGNLVLSIDFIYSDKKEYRVLYYFPINSGTFFQFKCDGTRTLYYQGTSVENIKFDVNRMVMLVTSKTDNEIKFENGLIFRK